MTSTNPASGNRLWLVCVEHATHAGFKRVPIQFCGADAVFPAPNAESAVERGRRYAEAVGIYGRLVAVEIVEREVA